MKKIFIFVILVLLLCKVAWAIEIPVQWTDTVAITDTSTVCTTITDSKSYPVYENEYERYLYFYPTFDIRGVPAIQATRDCSINVIIQYSMDDSTWSTFDSQSVDIGTTDTLILIANRIKPDSVSADSMLPRVNWFRAKVIKWVAYTDADTSIVGNYYWFDVRLWLTGRY